jgi:hypothetical protein
LLLCSTAAAAVVMRLVGFPGQGGGYGRLQIVADSEQWRIRVMTIRRKIITL